MKTILFGVIFLALSYQGYSQSYQAVQITRNAEEVKGLVKVCDINETAQIPFASQSKLRDRAILKAKQTAFVNGAGIVLIILDNFADSPLNNVNIRGAGYALAVKPDKGQKEKIAGESCEDAKAELLRYKEKFGDLDAVKDVHKQ